MKRAINITSISAFLSLLFITSACNVSPTPNQLATSQPTQTEIPPTQIPIVESSPTPIPEMRLVPTGETQLVFDWSEDRCDDYDIPDLPARAFRDVDGNVQLLSTHLDNRRFIGPNLNEIKRDCQVVMRSAHDGDVSKYSDNTWLAAPYTEDGQTIYAVVHQEYHGWEHGETCPGDNFSCWYNSLTMAISSDAGLSYKPIAEPPDHLIATLPKKYEPGAGPYGVFEPSNIIKKDGFYYLFVRIDDFKSDAQRICLMRTDDLSNPTSWRAWDGSDFTIETVNPYLNPDAADGAQACAALDGDLGVMDSSITFNTYLNKYVMVGTTAVNIAGQDVWGVLYAFSDDLIDWQPRQLLFEMPLPWTFEPGDANVYLYPSLIDPNSDSRNFETTGKTAYLYLTRFNDYTVGNPLDRDLIRVQLEFFKTENEAAQAEVPFQP